MNLNGNQRQIDYLSFTFHSLSHSLTGPELVDVEGPEVGGAPDANIAGEGGVAEPALLAMKLKTN